MPCYVCNPQCGRCRPPRPAPRKCPECGKLVLGEASSCRHCGARLQSRPGVFCKFTDRICLVPCVRANELNPEGFAAQCPWGERFGIDSLEEGA